MPSELLWHWSCESGMIPLSLVQRKKKTCLSCDNYMTCNIIATKYLSHLKEIHVTNGFCYPTSWALSSVRVVKKAAYFMTRHCFRIYLVVFLGPFLVVRLEKWRVSQAASHVKVWQPRKTSKADEKCHYSVDMYDNARDNVTGNIAEGWRTGPTMEAQMRIIKHTRCLIGSMEENSAVQSSTKLQT